MISLAARHPSEDDLLRYADGELSARQAARVRSHLEACWRCRAELDALQKTIGACVQYREDVLKTCLPEPPLGWMDIRRRFAEIDGYGAATVRERHPASWLAAAVAAAIMLAVFSWLRQPPAAQAAELLRKAVAAAKTRPEPPRRVLIRTRKRGITRVLPAKNSDVSQLSELQALFEAAHYSWEDPLSARSFQAWRDQLPEKRDEVTTSTERSCYEIRTTTNSGELLEATLKLRIQDLRPLEGTLQFRNDEQVEMTEEPPDELSVPAAAKPAEPSREPAKPDVVSSATAADELRVLSILHQLEADLGDPIEVARAGRDVVVTGIGVAPNRQQQIQAALASLPRVVVRFSEPAAAAVSSQTDEAGPISVGAAASSVRARLEKDAGGRAQLEFLASQVLDECDAMMSRVYALRRLAEHFPERTEAELREEERLLLRTLRQKHAAALTRRAAQIDRLMTPLLSSMAAPPARAPAAAAPAAWQAATEELFRAARRVEKLLAAALGGSSTEVAPDAVPGQLLSGLLELRASAEAYERAAGAGVRER